MKSFWLKGMIVVATIFFMTGSCTPVNDGLVIGEDGTKCGKIKQRWRGKWWDLYERGLSYYPCGKLDMAEMDFSAAIIQRDRDERKAETTSIEYIDYFPHRELGVIYYKTGRYEKAVSELRYSLETENSAKARYYLAEAQKAILNKTGDDKTAPEVLITYPLNGAVLSEFSFRLKAKITDENPISGVKVNQIPLFIDEEKRTFEITQQVPIVPGQNRIVIEAEDLAGNVRKKTVLVNGDHQGPIISVVNTIKNIDRLMVNVVYQDEYGIQYIRVGDKKLHPVGKSGRLSFDLDWQEDRSAIEIEAADVAGNKTRGSICISMKKRNQTLVASADGVLGIQTATDGLFAANVTRGKDEEPPDIELKGLSKLAVDCTDDVLTIVTRKRDKSFFIEGRAWDESGIKYISINQESVYKAPDSAKPGKVKNIFFNKRMELDPGAERNFYTIMIMDANDNIRRKMVCVNREIQGIDQNHSRMKVGIKSFPAVSAVPGMHHSIYEGIGGELKSSRRFKILNRDRAFLVNLEEDNLSLTDLAEKQGRLKPGEKETYEAVFTGYIRYGPDEMELNVRLTNRDSDVELFWGDVYTTNTSKSGRDNVINGLVSKIVQTLPMLEGRILSVTGDRYKLSIGSGNYHNENLARGMKCIVYREKYKNENGKEVLEQFDKLGVLEFTAVHKEHSWGKLEYMEADSAGFGPIVAKDKVITK